MATSFKDLERTLYGNLTSQAGPARQGVYGYYGNILNAGNNWAAAAGPEFDKISKQYDVARRNLTNNAAAFGGGLSRNLAQLESDKAFGIGQIIGGLRPTAADKLASMTQADYGTALDAIRLAQSQEMADAERRSKTMSSIGGLAVDILKTPGLVFGKGGLLGGAAGGVAPAVSSAAAAGMFAANPLTAGIGTQSIIGSTTAGGSAGTGGGLLAGAGHSLGLGGGSGLFGLGAATIPVVGGAIVGGTLLAKHLIGRGRKAANAFVNNPEGQEAFGQHLSDIAELGKYNPKQAGQALLDAWNNFNAFAQSQLSQGGHKALVARQALNTPGLMNTVATMAQQLGVTLPGFTWAVQRV